MSVGAIGASPGYQMAIRPLRPASGGGDPAARFEEMDSNGDGGLDITESGLSQQDFTLLDVNGDGLLTQADFEANKPQGGPRAGGMGPPHDPSKLISKLDSDGDGAISQAESGWGSDMFNQVDTNGDGKITLEELKAHDAAQQQAMMQMGPPPDASGYLSGYGMSAYQDQNDLSLLSLLASQAAGSAGSLDLTA